MLLLRLEIGSLLFLPGFLAAFLIGWFRAGTRRSGLKLLAISAGVGVGGAALIVGALVALFMYSTGVRVDDHSATPLTAVQARAAGCPIRLPDGAHDVRFATASGGIQAYEALVRFEAPVEVCRRYIQAAHPTACLAPLNSVPPAKYGDMVGPAPWFDVRGIQHGTLTSLEKEDIWVDTDRGVLYSRVTD